jgi:crossover junction endodeoxyribonuclease RuvC
MASKTIVGIDPGLTGGFAVWMDGKIVDAWNTPTFAVVKNHKKRNHLDCAKIIMDLQNIHEPHVIIEQQQAYKGQGVSTTFTTGKNYGILLGLLDGLDIPYTIVTPQAWKKALKLGKDKQLSFDLGNELFPDACHHWLRKKDDGVVEAALLAHYGATQL